MRAFVRGLCLASALALGAVTIAGCQREQQATEDGPTTPTNAEREAEIASEQLAALGGPANAQQRALFEGEFQASGGIGALDTGEGSSEGAWELRLLPDYAQFSRPGLGEDGGIPGEREYRERGMRVVAGAVTITIMNQACTSSGGELPYTAHVLFEGVAYTGCARRGITEGERPTWASVLPELIPAIDACLARAESRPARVTFASTLGEGEVSVRIREANGSRHECISNSAGSEVFVFEPLSDLDRRPGEGDPEFQRGVNQPAAQNCRTSEAAVSRSGDQLGWLVRRSC